MSAFGTKLSWAALMCIALSGCAGQAGNVSLSEEQALDTDGSSLARYHLLLQDPFALGLRSPGFLIGLEKSPRDAVRGPTDGPSYDTGRYRLPARYPAGVSDADVARQQDYFKGTFDDSKVVFLSHLLKYELAPDTAGIDTKLVHSAYDTTGFPKALPRCDTTGIDGAYDRGWAALACLQNELGKELRHARTQGRPYSHILVMSMGWNNDQVVSVQRFNSIVGQTKAAAARKGQRFAPLVVALTWPSVWGGGAGSEVLRTAGHIASYSTRARDADEIGFSYANAVLNQVLPPVEDAFDIQTIVIGHSFGARILTRAHASAPYLKGHKSREAGKGPLIIGLQPAFSARRFLADQSSVADILPGLPAEGGPFQSIERLPGQLAFTWSSNDTPNQIARFVTGALHVGGAAGRAKLAGQTARFEFSTGLTKVTSGCKAARRDQKMQYIDGSAFIDGHSDITSPEMGTLIWDLIACFNTQP